MFTTLLYDQGRAQGGGYGGYSPPQNLSDVKILKYANFKQRKMLG